MSAAPGPVGRLVDRWYAPRLSLLTAALLPLSWLFAALVALRRLAYRAGLFASQRLRVPVVVVGNLTVGGGGKTPATLALARALAQRGERPGLLSRGYGGSDAGPRWVRVSDDAAEVGDEPLLLARSGFPVVIGHDRAKAGRALLAGFPATTVVLCDDGLQHLALARDAELVVVDARRGFGNGHMLPAGPLREPLSRLARVDAIARSGDAVATTPDGRETRIATRALHWRRVADDATVADAPACWQGLKVAAIAGIANPARFFADLAAAGIVAATRAFGDHHAFVAADLPADADVVLMTEKDAVKCQRFADARCHYLPIEAILDARLVERIAARVAAAQAAPDSTRTAR